MRAKCKAEVRPAVAADVSAMVELITAYRELLAQWEPRFWNPAADAAAKSAFFFGALIADERPIVMVAVRDETIVGFAILMPIAVPPVYDAGPAATLDDFVVGEGDDWLDVGKALLVAVRACGRARGWQQLIAVCPAADRRKAALFEAERLTTVTHWRTAAM